MTFEIRFEMQFWVEKYHGIEYLFHICNMIYESSQCVVATVKPTRKEHNDKY